MKAYHLANQSKLTKWLLIVALLYSLVACLGGDIVTRNELKLSPKTELSLATEQSVNQHEPVKVTQKLNRFYPTFKYNRSTVSMVYNRLINNKLKLSCCYNFTCIRSPKFVQVKTIPASSDEAFSA